MTPQGKTAGLYWGLAIGLIGVGSLSVMTGSTDLLQWRHFLGFLGGSNDEATQKAWLVFSQLRLPRIVLAGQAGAALGVSGALLQSYFKNPLAEPYILGISSAAAFGAVLWAALVAGWAGLNLGGMLCAFASALATVLLVCAIARSDGALHNHRVLLAGVAVGVLFSALTMGVLLNSGTQQFRAFLHWMMGSVAHQSWGEIRLLGPVVVLGIAFSIRQWRELDWLALDEDAAFTAGVPVRQTRRAILGIAVVLAAASVAVCGTVAFVGLIVPHILRRLGGAGHRHLLLQSAFGGALLVMTADYVGRVGFPGQEMPLSLVTSAVGALFFLTLLKSGTR